MSAVKIRVGNRIFTPRLLPTVMTVVMLPVLIALGTWQIHRAEWKGQLIADWKAKAEQPVLEDLLPPDQSKEALFRKTKLMGKFLNDKSVQLSPRSRDNIAGSELITPFKMLTGEIILVDRGFVASESHASIDQPIGTVFVEGQWLPFPKRGWMQPDNVPAREQWYWFDSAGIVAFKGLPQPYPLQLVALGKPLNNVWPRPQAPEMPYADNHLSYAFTWFSLALALAVIYFLSQTKKE